MVVDWPTRFAGALRGAVIRAMPAATVVLDAASHLVAAAWRVVRRPVLFAVNVILALLLLFEEWGWQPLVALLGQLARFRLWARMEVWIAGLPPYGALVVFALPTLILFPLKVAGVWLLANGHVLTAGALLFAAKIASTAFIARAFLLTKPALMRIAWFRWAYERFVPWKDALFAQIRASWAWRYGRMVKTRVKLETKRAWLRWKPPLEAVWARAKTGVRKGWARVRVAVLAFWQRWRGAERL